MTAARSSAAAPAADTRRWISSDRTASATVSAGKPIAPAAAQMGGCRTNNARCHRLDDGSAVATGKTQVREAVEARTDLTFEQFRRTVLLAQGEFDAFLLAAESERAELLEKITGTEIYAAISIRVHEGTEARRRTVEQLEQRRGDIGLLDE